MKLLSWNVNGLRACLGKGFAAAIEAEAPDILCLQETRCGPADIEGFTLPGTPFSYLHPAEKAGYSGTMILAKSAPIGVETDFGDHRFAGEGRVICAEYPEFYLVNAYVPNSQNELRRLEYRVGEWEPRLRHYLRKLDQEKPVIYCGDLNVAHQEIDLARPGQNHRSAGFTDEEREALTLLLRSGFTDTFRHLHPDLKGAYSWWSFRGGARARNVGWRLDYVIVSEKLIQNVERAFILPEVHGSDHCPVGLTLSSDPAE